MNKKAGVVRVYLPPDANCLLSVTDHCLRSRNYINVVVAGKQPAPQWLTMPQAVAHCAAGVGVWDWASTGGDAPDVVLACCGDVPTLEAVAAVALLRRHLPAVTVRVVNVVDLMKLQPAEEHPHGLTDAAYDALFTRDRPNLFVFHGYPWLIPPPHLPPGRPRQPACAGVRRGGHHDHPFDMCVRNRIDRFHLVLDVIARVPGLADRAGGVADAMRAKLDDHHRYIVEHGADMPDVSGWRWAGTHPSAAARSAETPGDHA